MKKNSGISRSASGSSLRHPSFRRSRQGSTVYSFSSHSSRDRDESTAQAHPLNSIIDKSKLPRVCVLVTQLEHFDKDTYVTCQSPDQSNQSLSLEESSLRTISSFPGGIEEGFIVPDSQSLPGSSSFTLTSSGSRYSSSIDHSSFIATAQVSSTVSTFTSCQKGSSSIVVHNSSDSSTRPRGVFVPASHSSTASSQKTESAPLPYSAGYPASPRVQARQASLLRSRSEVTLLSSYERQLQERNLLSEDSAGAVRSVEGDQDTSRRSPRQDSQRALSPVEIQIPGSIEGIIHHSVPTDRQTAEENLVLQTQLPSQFTSDIKKSHTTSARKLIHHIHELYVLNAII